MLLALCPFLLYSQSNINVIELDDKMERTTSKSLEGTLAIGVSAYEGDLLSFDDENLGLFSDLGFSIAIGVKKHFNEHFTLGITYTNLTVSADEANFSDPGHKARGYSFENNLNEISILAEYFPFADKNWKLQPYVYVGPGLVFGSSDTNFRNVGDTPNTANINKDISEAKSSSFVLPIGFGAQMDLTSKITLSAQASLRFLANDYIDGTSQAGNSDVGDYYGDGGLKIGYKF